jgi:hypothetical protein
MCRVKNLTNTSLDFDSWFANLKTDAMENVSIPEFQGEIDLDELLAPLPMFESTFTPETIEPIQVTSYPSPPPSHVPVPNLKRSSPVETQVLQKRQRQNEAAKRCRQKKVSLIHQSQAMAKAFEEEKFQMSVQLAVLEKEKLAWISRERELQHQIATLKQQLDESHMILMNVNQ